MRCFNLTIFSFLILLAFSACTEEAGLTPVAQNSYIKIIEGKGTDAPLRIEQFNGDLLIVSNSTIVERGVSSDKVRILRVNLNGDEISKPDYYYPRNSNQNWTAKDVAVLGNDRIVIAGSVGEGDSLFFLEINGQLDSINSQYYSSDMSKYELTGLSFDEGSSKLLFGGSERDEDEGGDEFTLFGQMNAQNLKIEQTFRSNKADVLPATSILEDASGGLIWAYNTSTQNSVLIKSSDRSMRQMANSEALDFQSAKNVETKQLIKTLGGDIFILGELIEDENEDNEKSLFFYKAYSGNPYVFGADGNNQFSRAKEIEGGYLVVGSTETSEAGTGLQRDFLLSRRRADGSQVFSESFGSDADEELHDAVMVNDHIYSIGSTVIGIENTLLLIKTDKFGELVN